MFLSVSHWLFTLLLIGSCHQETTVQIHLYNSDRVSDSDWFHDCLLYNGADPYPEYESSGTVVHRPHQLIPYCIRELEPSNEYSVMHGIPITFQTLLDSNVTSEMLYLSSVPIDIVEQYGAFLANPLKMASEKLYNCSRPWFGEFCQYRLTSMESFQETVKNYFHALRDLPLNWDAADYLTCYTFIACDRGPWPSCLDWREICDGKIDCLNGGVDETDCGDLDINECHENEYRCANGFCIPRDFFSDDLYNPDCMDASDEKDSYEIAEYSEQCQFDPVFRCEERSCRDRRQDACGDGECNRGICRSERDFMLSQAKLSASSNSHLSYDCWMNLICLTFPPNLRSPVLNLTTECPSRQESKSLVTIRCPEQFFFPAQPIVLSHVRFLYERNATFRVNLYHFRPFPYYVCYTQHLCESIEPTVRFNKSSCLLFAEITRGKWESSWIFLERTAVDFFSRCLLTESTHTVCSNSKPYRCANSSKCLPLNRLMDGAIDCIEEDDEHLTDSCSLPDHQFRFKCLWNDICVDIRSVDYNNYTCKVFNEWTGEISVIPIDRDLIYPQSFATVCDGFIEHSATYPLNYTDEMNCQLWPCNNTYTRCDEQSTWNCLNGADEADCPGNPCRPHGHPCLSLASNNFTCLPLSRINDGIIDCLGAYDERAHCRASTSNFGPPAYRCFNETKCIAPNHVCSTFRDCPAFEDNSDWCEDLFISAPLQRAGRNMSQSIENWNFRMYLDSLTIETLSRKLGYFTLRNHLVYPIRNATMADNVFVSHTKSMLSFELTKQSISHVADRYCKRGIPVYASDSKRRHCLCPPAYFGHRCEYQSERVSLTLQFRTTEWSIVFNLVVMLVDNTTAIHSFEQFDYLAIRDCRKKFNVNLLYSRSAKPAHRTYGVRIDAYDKATSKHVSSVLYPVQFLFLPVYRLSRQVDISRQDSSAAERQCPLKCVHGQCTHYLNRNEFFCRCFDGYSGELCSVTDECNCSPDSVCVGTVNKRSICVCPFDKFGPRCYSKRLLCTPHSCAANGQCVPTDITISKSGYFCMCSDGFTGPKCEQTESRITFSFAKNIIIPQSVLVHFIDITPKRETEKYRDVDPIQTTMIAKIRYDQTSVVAYHSGIFHLIFLQMNQNYYLAVLQHNHTSSINISTEIISENRCLSTSHFLEPHIRQYSAWRRARYYHTICQKQLDLQCFYDEDQFMCLCDVERFANCFKFAFKRTYNCFGNNYCENNGQCYQNDNTCPTASSCFCDECYYGTRCQFTSTGYGLSIDDILGYSIWPRVSFARQPTVIKVSTAVTLFMFLLSIVNGTLSMITFRTKKALAVGSGFYLLSASIASCLTMVLFALKFFLLIFSHISNDTSKTFLIFNCTIMDMFLKSCLAIVDWLYTCVAVERVWTIYKGAGFDKKQSVKLAKRITAAICLLTLGSYIHDAIFRRLLEDAEEQRMWCIVRYSPLMKAVSSAVNMIHFLVPLSINFLSVIAIIILLARQKLKVTDEKNQRRQLWSQFKQHKHYLLSSICLIVVAVPRLVISFVSKCMTTARQPWVYLTAYFMSFVSSLLIFVFFALPSEFYRKQFVEETLRFKKTIQRRFRL